MEYKKYFPQFIAPWSSGENRIEIRAITNSITLEGMDVNTIKLIENLCSGILSLDNIISELSKEWERRTVISLFDLFIEKQIIVNINSINKLSDSFLKKIETIIPNQDVLKKMNLDYEIIYGRVDLGIWSCGKDASLEVAKKKLISEILEWNIWSSKEDVKYSRAIDLMNDFVNPNLIIKYSESQYAESKFLFKKFDLGKEYGWLRVKNLSNSKNTYVLAEHVLFPYVHKHQYTKSTSSGCAAHSQKEKVVNHALFELVERDAFMIYWLNKLDMPIVDQRTIPSTFYSRILSLNELGYTVVIRSIGLDISPVILISVRDVDGNYVTCGMASGYSAEKMIDSALSEVEISILHLLNLDSKENIFFDPCDVRSLQQHEELHQQVKHTKETDFMFQNGNLISFEDFKFQVENIQSISRRIEELGFDILELDASTWKTNILLPEFRFVSKVIVPGLVPLSYGYNNEPLGMERIYAIPKLLELNRIDLKEGKLNNFPHPFN